MNNLQHTPDGVRDIYGDECARKIFVKNELFSLIKSFGYCPIQTPSFEYFDVFGLDVGTTPSRELYKFFDHEGNTLVLRPDFTPSVARAYAKYFKESNVPVRFLYEGSSFSNPVNYRGRLNETAQIGAELMGERSIDSDAEIIALNAGCFEKAGLCDFIISIGDSGIFRAVFDAAKMDEDTEKEFKEYICSKNYFAAEKLSEEKNYSKEVTRCFKELPNLSGGVEMLDDAALIFSSFPRAKEAILRLKDVYNIIAEYGYDKYVAFDLSLLSPYDYYTGIIFEGFSFGTGEAISKGGRYDELLGKFGKDAPAVGMVIMIDSLMSSLDRQKIDIGKKEEKTVIIYSSKYRIDAINKAKELRKSQRSSSLVLYDDLKNDTETDDYYKSIGYDVVRMI